MYFFLFLFDLIIKWTELFRWTILYLSSDTIFLNPIFTKAAIFCVFVKRKFHKNLDFLEISFWNRYNSNRI